MAFNFQILGLPAAVTAQIGEYAKIPDNQRRGATRDAAEWMNNPGRDEFLTFDFKDSDAAFERSLRKKIPRVVRTVSPNSEDMTENYTTFQISGSKSGRKKKKMKNYWIFHDESWFNRSGSSSESSPSLD